jgi:hypothetical protein
MAMTDFSAEGASGAAQPPAGAAGGTPDESDLPALQGLDNSTDDPDDPDGVADATGSPLDVLGGAGEAQGSSDPMPDMSGTDS